MKIEPHYVEFSTAKLLKEKGFDLPTTHYYFEDGEFKENVVTGTNYYGEEYEFYLSEFNENWNDKWLTNKSGNRCFGCSKNNGYFETYSAPEQWMVIEWLRVKYDIWVVIWSDTNLDLPEWKDSAKWFYVINCNLISCYDDKEKLKAVYNTPKEAYNSAFDYILNNML